MPVLVDYPEDKFGGVLARTDYRDPFIRDEIEWCANQIGAERPRPKYAGRPPSAATATGLLAKHNEERDALIWTALGDTEVEDTVVAA